MRGPLTCVIVHLFALHRVRSHDGTHNWICSYTPVAWDSNSLRWDRNVCSLMVIQLVCVCLLSYHRSFPSLSLTNSSFLYPPPSMHINLSLFLSIKISLSLFLPPWRQTERVRERVNAKKEEDDKQGMRKTSGRQKLSGRGIENRGSERAILVCFSVCVVILKQKRQPNLSDKSENTSENPSFIICSFHSAPHEASPVV